MVDYKPFRAFGKLSRPTASGGIKCGAAFFPYSFPKVVKLSNLAEKRGVRVPVGETHIFYSKALLLQPREVSQCRSVAVRFFVELKEWWCQCSFSGWEFLPFLLDRRCP